MRLAAVQIVSTFVLQTKYCNQIGKHKQRSGKAFFVSWWTSHNKGINWTTTGNTCYIVSQSGSIDSKLNSVYMQQSVFSVNIMEYKSSTHPEHIIYTLQCLSNEFLPGRDSFCCTMSLDPTTHMDHLTVLPHICDCSVLHQLQFVGKPFTYLVK